MSNGTSQKFIQTMNESRDAGASSSSSDTTTVSFSIGLLGGLLFLQLAFLNFQSLLSFSIDTSFDMTSHVDPSAGVASHHQSQSNRPEITANNSPNSTLRWSEPHGIELNSPARIANTNSQNSTETNISHSHNYSPVFIEFLTSAFFGLSNKSLLLINYGVWQWINPTVPRPFSYRKNKKNTYSNYLRTAVDISPSY